MNGSEGFLIREIRGPITLITVGALFALNNFTPYRFSQTWPVILIVFGLLSLLGRAPAASGPSAGGPAAPPTAYPPGGYRQSQYPGTAPGPSSQPGSGPLGGGV